MNTLYNFVLGRKNSSTANGDRDGDDADEAASDDADEVVDENGFVIVNSEERQRERSTQVFFITPLFYFFHNKCAS